MSELRIVLMQPAADRWEELLRAAIEPGDVLLNDSDAVGSADVIVFEVDDDGVVDRHVSRVGNALIVALGMPSDTLLDPRIDALWDAASDSEDVKLVLARARERRVASNDPSTRALDAILTGQQARADALRRQLAHENRARDELPAAPELSCESPYIALEDSSAFESALRHEVRRALREGTRALLLALDAEEHALRAESLRTYDVVLARPSGGALVLIADADDATIDRARLQLADRARALPDDADTLLRWMWAQL